MAHTGYIYSFFSLFVLEFSLCVFC